MAQEKRNHFEGVKAIAQKGLGSIDTDAIKDKVTGTAEVIKTKANEAKDTILDVKDDLAEKLTELDRMLKNSITEYNDAYTLMNDKGVKLFVERSRAVDSVSFVEGLVNSIANKPKSFTADFEQITSDRQKFTEACDFAERELMDARIAAAGAGAGLAAGASVAFMAPTAAMWVATTFGTASTGAAISSLSGAAATNAALAWLGGGALAAGGQGMAAGSAFLAMAGPLGWTIAGATLLSSILVLSTKKVKLNKEKNEEIQSIKENTERVREMDAKIDSVLKETSEIRCGLNEQYVKAVHLYGADYQTLEDDEKMLLGALVNNTKSMAAMFCVTVGE